MARGRKPSKQNQPQNAEFMAFPPIGAEFENQNDPVETPGAAAPKADAALEARLAKMEAMLEAATRRNEAPIYQQAPQQVQQQQQQVQPPVSFDGLPDPVTTPKEFQAALAARMQDAIRNQVSQATTAAVRDQIAPITQKQRVDDLWGKFNKEHEDLSEYPEVIKSQAERIIGAAQARGLDTERYIFADPDSFIREVADGTRSRLEAMGISFGEADDEGPATSGRTNGILGGGTAVPAGSGGGEKGAPKTSTFVDEIKEVQKKMGVF